MKRLLFVLACVVALVLAAGLVVPFFLPKETLRRQVVTQVEAATGWRLRIDGPVSLSLLPSFHLSARDVGLSGEAGADGIEFVKVREIDFSLALSALFGGQARITAITLNEPRILLETDAWGKTSWAPRRVFRHQRDTLAQAAERQSGDAPAEVAPAGERDAQDDASGLDGGTVALLRRIRIDALTLEEGTLVYADRRSGSRRELKDINVTLAIPALDDEATLSGDLVVQGLPLAVDARVGAPLDLAQGRPSELLATLTSDQATLRLEGEVGTSPLGGALEFEASGPSLETLLASLGVVSDGIGGLDAFSANARADLTPQKVTISGLKATVGAATLEGQIVAGLSGPKPKLEISLVVPELDLEKFRPGPSQPASPATSEEGAAGTGAPQDAPKEAASVAVTTIASPSGAAEGPDAGKVDLSVLQGFDAEASLKIGRISGSGVELRDATVSAVVRDGLLAAELEEISGFGGSAGAVINASQRGERASLAGTFRTRDVDLAQVMALLGRPEQLSGTLQTRLSYATEGSTSQALVGNVEAQGSVALRDGAYAGLGLAEALGGDALADRLEDLDVEVTVDGLDQPLSATGNLSWRGERFDLAATATPATLAIGGALPVEASLRSAQVRLGAKGTATVSGGFDGKLSVATPNLRQLLAWIGQPLPPGDGLGAFSVEGRFEKAGDTLRFSETKLALDGTSGQGEGSVALGGARPAVKADFSFDRIVLDPYLGGGNGTAQGGTSQGGPAGASPGGGASSGWSTEPIDFSALAAVDAEVSVAASQIIWDKITVGQSALGVDLKGGVLTAELSRLTLYEGAGTGRVVLDGAQATPTVSARVALENVSAFPLLRDGAGFEWIEGAATLKADVASSGRSQADLVAALDGTASALFTNGAIRGINIPKMMRGLSVQTLLGWQDSAQEKTDFSELSASFVLAKGVATNTDLKLVGPLVRVSGQGTTNLPAKTLDWRVEPKVVASLQGQGAGEEDLAGLGVPVIIKGSWSNPQIYPDIAGILENPAEAYKQLQGLGGGLVKALGDNPAKAVKDVVKQVTNGNGSIDIRKVIEGEADDEAVLKVIEEGFQLPSGIFGLGKKKGN